MGDWLIVSVVPDKYVTKRKVIYDEQTRVRLLKALRCVDQVILCDGPGPEDVIRRMQPDIYVRGPDYQGKEMPESALLRKLGIKVHYTAEFSDRSTKVIQRVLNG